MNIHNRNSQFLFVRRNASFKMANKPDLTVHNGRIGVWKDSGNKNAVEFEVSKTNYNSLLGN